MRTWGILVTAACGLLASCVSVDDTKHPAGTGGAGQGGTQATGGTTASGGTGGVPDGGGAGGAPAGGGSGGATTGGSTSGGAGGSTSGGTGGSTSGGAGGLDGAAGSGGATNPIPVTCSEAASQKSHFGCEFWPTVTPTQVWSIFDFAVMVVNPGSAPATITVKGGAGGVLPASVPAHGAELVYLPWVPGLKGADADSCGAVSPSVGSALEKGGAYQLTSDTPVAVFQHAPIEYQGSGGPAGKDWSSCPGNQLCSSAFTTIGCYSFTSDSSLLLPTTSLGKSYLVLGTAGWPAAKVGGFAAITATADATSVTVTLSSTAAVMAGGGVSAKNAGEAFNVMLDKGDVVVLQAPDTADLSGSSVVASNPVEVVTGINCAQVPAGTQACDHLEEVLPPLEALGKHYVVPVPQGPKGDTPGHVVRLYGVANGTQLSYAGATPTGAPTTLGAGEVAEIALTQTDFDVSGDKPFGVMSLLPGGAILDPSGGTASQLGDPSSRLVAPVEQFRKAYAVAAAPSYGVSHIEVVVPLTATLMLDGVALAQAPTAIGSGGFGVLRIGADSTSAVEHVLTADQPFAVQIVGYGKYTSYAHPGGMNVDALP